MVRSMSETKTLAKTILSGEIGILAGSREMVHLYHGLGLDDRSFDVFKALDSETDDCLLEPIAIPISVDRREKNSRQIREYEEFYREEIFERCRLFPEELE